MPQPARGRRTVAWAIVLTAMAAWGFVLALVAPRIGEHLRVRSAQRAASTQSLIGRPISSVEREFGKSSGSFNGWTHAIDVGASPGIPSIDRSWLLLRVDSTGAVTAATFHIE